jgi:hypothetical protein
MTTRRFGSAAVGQHQRRDERLARLPDFLIVGAMRCGTTALARYLGAHPDVYMAPEKETHFFDRHFDRGTSWYASRFEPAGGIAAIGEATQSYMYDIEALQRIAQVLPDAKLITLLRDPVDRAYSHYWLNRARGLERLSFPQAVAAEPGRLRSGSRRDRFVFSYIDRGRYLEQLKRICERFPRSALHVVIFEDMTRDARGVFREACRHIRVDPTFAPPDLGRKINAHVTFRSPGLRRIAKRLPRTLARCVGTLNVRKGGYEPMSPDVRSALADTFREDVRSLSAWLGHDLSEWTD